MENEKKILKSDLELTKIGYFLGVKIWLFLRSRILVVFQVLKV